MMLHRPLATVGRASRRWAADLEPNSSERRRRWLLLLVSPAATKIAKLIAVTAKQVIALSTRTHQQISVTAVRRPGTFQGSAYRSADGALP
jgi:hypothetical protein